jgi:hypothetical protein
MPKVRTTKQKPPAGWELLEPTILQLEQRMRDGSLRFVCLRSRCSPHPLLPSALHVCAAESESHEGKRKAETV